MVKIREIWPEILDHGTDIDEQIELFTLHGYLKNKRLISWLLKETRI